MVNITVTKNFTNNNNLFKDKKPIPLLILCRLMKTTVKLLIRKKSNFWVLLRDVTANIHV